MEIKKQIIAIGGHKLSSNDAALRYIIRQTEKPAPKIAFLPQASLEDKAYVLSFYQACTELGAVPSWVSLFGIVADGWQERLLQQDVIFVGGGNTKSMLALWREWGLDEVLKIAYNKGIILAGVSAGAICWFEQGITDSFWPMRVLDCLGILSGSCCPHYDSESERQPVFTARVADGTAKPGIALSDYTAAHYIDGRLSRLLSWQPNRKVYTVTADGQTELATVSL